jgi:hypothetical protein
MHISRLRQPRQRTAPPHSGTVTSRRLRMNCGRLEAVQKDRRKKIGSMPQNNCDPTRTPGNPELGDHGCPKCGVEMEPIEIGVEGPPLEHLQLCPGCYLVTWSDEAGLHLRQGVPMKNGVSSEIQPSETQPVWLSGEPEEC